LATVGFGFGTDDGEGGETGTGSDAGREDDCVVSAGPGRSGRNLSGSRYPFGSAVSRTPRWTYGPGISPAGGPIVPTTAPSTTEPLRLTAIEARWTRVTEYPSSVAIVTDRP
jgi:hypothetical protein